MTDLVDHNEDIKGQALDRLPYQFRDKAYWTGLLEALLPSIQEVEDVLYDLIVDRFLEGALGAQLDQYGDLLDEGRQGLSDDEFRRILRSRILSNRSTGAIEDLVKLASRVTGSEVVRLFNIFPAFMSIEYVVPASDSAAFRKIVVRLLERATSAGVGLKVVEGVTGYFGFAGDPRALGFGEGKLSTRIDDNG